LQYPVVRLLDVATNTSIALSVYVFTIVVVTSFLKFRTLYIEAIIINTLIIKTLLTITETIKKIRKYKRVIVIITEKRSITE